MNTFPCLCRALALVLALCLTSNLRPAPAADESTIDLGSRRELFVDDFLLERQEGVELRMHRPTPHEIVLKMDAAWEGSGSGYETVFRDGDVIRMYYVGADLTSPDGASISKGRPVYACYAESRDGIEWTKPSLGLFEFEGSKENNIVWAAPHLDNFTPFKDPNPDCLAGEEYKAVSSGKGGLFAYKSRDGIHWSRLVEEPIISKGAFDTQNNAFWDELRGHYWCYIRDFHTGIRDIRVSTSPDFRSWTEPVLLHYGDAPDEALYTNQVRPYYRAPHLFVGFPTRYVERAWSPSMAALPDPEHRQARMKFSPRYGTAVTDLLLMTSRDGHNFQRWDEAFLPPGPERKDNWVYGDGYPSLGLLETPAEDPTAPPVLTLYVGEDHWKGPIRLRRWTMRIDGFVSLHGRRTPGEALTRPLTFTGRELALNFATSAAGWVRVELQDAAGKPLPGFTLDDCDETFGDALDRVITWKGNPDVSSLAGTPVRLRIVLSDGDVYALQFRDAP